MNVASQFSTSIPEVWELNGYEFIKICDILIEDMKRANGQVSGPVMSLDSVQAFGRILEQTNGR